MFLANAPIRVPHHDLFALQFESQTSFIELYPTW